MAAIIFMNGVTEQPFNCFSQLVPVSMTGAEVKNLIATVDARDPTRYDLIFNGVLIDMQQTLHAQGVKVQLSSWRFQGLWGTHRVWLMICFFCTQHKHIQCRLAKTFKP
jgi:hypothetical protein